MDNKYILAYQYETFEFVGVFPKDATDSEITYAIGKELAWKEIPLIYFEPAQTRVFIQTREDK